ncbi:MULTISPECIES: pseudaminic acid cytidylyltransferase [unclassified Lentimonas]|uniref:pseudaminic acid cytidylyltransferase n=1 Tax=unclassified Lentimonas TaxID=2630993 RepID=UPI0013224097|nr:MULTISPECIES: pseudaminic acid cytidylyltransferase [unclassified Lentimonas]CAA6676535.1 N-Acetylneuraminate cytidylyltransferase (EC [Lentimonas sp. CC4]CAA6685375.1 N-Acetylneuraminate cytidylyltransferase (EC [Lentimonas sp. CC6]CAA7074901.1 N-Acetylneuraminate cytidylyltransferase (EC [Lentimonas sp. CC4]CAA7169526.1 N-Acetylneuraminate cytidylyltransferase (EC [Lentimonas sp. CC21]CAA7182712.1 N-Acetylneuraminate cytidylyltransferase (EC [Lentimonas sp. CC8]
MSPLQTIAVIPARGGSKRIPHKNIKPFCGKPMITYSIEAAIKCGLFDQVIVSTDDEEIAEIAEKHGAICPFRRPAHLSGDYTPTLPVVRHAIETVEAQQNTALKQVCCIYATAPFLKVKNLQAGHTCLQANSELEFAFSVTTYPVPIQRALYLDPKSGSMKMFHPEHADTRSQDLKESYHDAGQFYWGWRDAYMQTENIFLAKSAPILLPREEVQDIDTLEDWNCAEQLHHLHLAQQS